MSDQHGLWRTEYFRIFSLIPFFKCYRLKEYLSLRNKLVMFSLCQLRNLPFVSPLPHHPGLQACLPVHPEGHGLNSCQIHMQIFLGMKVDLYRQPAIQVPGCGKWLPRSTSWSSTSCPPLVSHLQPSCVTTQISRPPLSPWVFWIKQLSYIQWQKSCRVFSPTCLLFSDPKVASALLI